jgi:hypothetical protein
LDFFVSFICSFMLYLLVASKRRRFAGVVTGVGNDSGKAPIQVDLDHIPGNGKNEQ